MNDYINNYEYKKRIILPTKYSSDYSIGFNQINNYESAGLRNINNNQFETQSNATLSDPDTAFKRGNLFNNLYEQYKNYQPSNLKSNNPQQSKLNEINEYSFAAHDLNLYLDNFPNNRDALKLFNRYRQLANELTMEYEKEYEPLNISSGALDKYPWNWDNSPWPWEGNI